jgi:P4 family phage/plasmid primase-like protien
MTADEDVEPATQAGARFAGAGMHVFPVDMRPDENGALLKAPLDGYMWKQRATTDLREVIDDVIEAEFLIGSENVGIAWAVGLDRKLALDLDSAEPEWWGELTETAVNVSKRGVHRIYDMPPGRRIGNSTSRFPTQGWGEVRGAGGYIVVWWPGDRPGFDVAELSKIVEFSRSEWLSDADEERPGVSYAELEAFKADHVDDGQVWRLNGFRTQLAERPPGSSRNIWGVRVACHMAREAAADLVSAAEAFAVLEEWWAELSRQGPEKNAKTGAMKTRKLTDRELRRIECYAVGQLTPERIAQERAKAQTAGHQPSGGFDVGRATDWNDSLLGQQLADELAPSWLYVTAWRRWLRWDGRRWAEDTTEAVHEAARQWMADLGALALTKVTKSGDPLLRRVLDYRRASSMENLVKVARRILAVDPTELDVGANLLNVHNGVLDLCSGELTPHEPGLMMTRLAGAAYDPTARHEDVVRLFECIDPGDVASMKMLLGVAATGHTGGDHLPVFDGTGSNGKTTLLLAASAALGDYAGPVPPELVMKSSREDHPTIKTSLQGLRLAYIEETEEEGGLRLERVKALTGGAPITGRRIGGDYYTFEPSHTLILATNHRPNVNSAEHAAWRRLHLIRFPYRYGTGPGDQPIDTGLRERVIAGREQRQTMLAVIVAGARKAYAAGEPNSPVVQWSAGIEEATAEWRGEEDVFWRFAVDALVFESSARVTLMEMFGRYQTWCMAEGRPPGQAKNLARRFEAHDAFRSVERRNPAGRITYVGVRLK